MSTYQRRPEPSIEKPLPQDIDAERSVLGLILLDDSSPNASLIKAAQRVYSGDFFDSRHIHIFRAMKFLEEHKRPIDLMILTDQLRTIGELEAAGGVAYVSSLIDGQYRKANLDHYADVVRKKAVARNIVYEADRMKTACLEGEDPEKQLADFASFSRVQNISHEKTRLIAVDYNDFLSMTLPPREDVIEPLLRLKGRGMIYSPRGAGKTYITLQLAYCVATGTNSFFPWNVPNKRPVIYVDGEMDAETMQERESVIGKVSGDVRPERGFLTLVTRDLQKEVRPHINSKLGRDQIEDHLRPGSLLILDNLSSLMPSSDEKETEDWAITEEWFSDLCWKGVTIIFVHHSGKGGDQRGTSKREDLLNFVLKLVLPSDYRPEEGLRVEVHIKKLRAKATQVRQMQPFEVRLGVDDNGDPGWQTQPLWGILRDRARQYLMTGMKPGEVALETGLSRYQVYRIRKEMTSVGLTDEESKPAVEFRRYQS